MVENAVGEIPQLCGHTMRVLEGKCAGMLAVVVEQKGESCKLLEISGGAHYLIMGEIEFEYSTHQLTPATAEEIAAYHYHFTLEGEDVCKRIGHSWQYYSCIYMGKHFKRCWCCAALVVGPSLERMNGRW